MPRDLQPQMGFVFYGFCLMYCMAMLMFGVAFALLRLRWQRRLYDTVGRASDSGWLVRHGNGTATVVP